MTPSTSPSVASSARPVAVVPASSAPVVQLAAAAPAPVFVPVPATLTATIVQPDVAVTGPVVSDSAKSLAAMVEGTIPVASTGNLDGISLAPNIRDSPFFLSAFPDKNATGSFRGALSGKANVTKSDTFTVAGLSPVHDVDPSEKNQWGKCTSATFVADIGDKQLLHNIQVGLCLKVYGAANPGGNNFPAFFDDATKIMVGRQLTARVGRKPCTVIEVVDGEIVTLPEGTVLRASWVIDAEISVFFWTFKEMHGLSATLHRVVVRRRPSEDQGLSTAKSYLAKYMTK